MHVAVILVVAGAAICVLLFVAGRAYLKFRGVRVVTCPETGQSAAVEVNARQAALASLGGKRTLHLQECSRWPERQGCGQECLSQIEQAPEDCLARRMLERWYEGSTCLICGKEIGVIDWATHKPALMNAEGRTLEWSEVPAQVLPEVLATHFPVCWDCHVVEGLCRKFPDRVVDRSGVERGEMGQARVPHAEAARGGNGGAAETKS